MGLFNRFEEFARSHVVVTPDDANDLDREMLIMAGTDGDLEVDDHYGTTVVYTVTAGAILPIVVKRVRAANTTVTQVIGLY